MLDHPITKWLNRYLGRPEILALIAVLACVYFVFVFFGKMLAPVFVSVVIAYLLQWPINKLESWKLPHSFSVLFTYLVFVGLVVLAIVGLLPALGHQLNNLFVQMPSMISRGQVVLNDLYQRYPTVVSPNELQQTLSSLRVQFLGYGQKLLSFSLASLSSLVMFCVYFILVPLLVYFFVMDKTRLLKGFKAYLPERRQLLSTVWLEVYEQMGHYVRGKCLEALIVAVAFFVQFSVMGLNYSGLMAVLVGLSVIIPYVGAVVVTIPLLIVAILQWGLSAYFGYFVVIYAVLIALDANLLVPLIFSEVVDLHPVSIILAILIFGGLFGFWGVFFAIPLASLVKAVARALHEAAK